MYQPIPIDSPKLGPVEVLVGRAAETAKCPEVKAAMPFQTLIQRRFRFETETVIRGAAEDRKEAELFFEGYTCFPPPYPSWDPLRPTLRLEGREFFDWTLPDEPIPALLLIGGPRNTGPQHQGKDTCVSSGPLQGEPVRAFVLEGADKDLELDIGLLAGWQDQLDESALLQTLCARHPLIVLDALRLAIESSSIRLIERLGQRLLHPFNGSETKVAALWLLGRFLDAPKLSEAQTNPLVELTWQMWRRERQHQVIEAYFETWNLAAGPVLRSGRLAEIRATSAHPNLLEKLMRLRETLRGRLEPEDSD